jgi:restriction system protein
MQSPQGRSADPRAPVAPIAVDPGADAVAQDPAASLEPARPQAWGKAVFEVIEWRRFEAVVERLFQQAGFQTQAKSHGADGGVDVWLYSRHQPGEPVSLVQCKHWRGRRVGVDKMRELRGVMAAQSIKRGQFVTTSSYTPEATAFARQNGITLLVQSGLLGLIAR